VRRTRLFTIRGQGLRDHPKPANENEDRDVDFGVRRVAFVDISYVLSEAKKQQVIALGRLGWPLRRIEQETGVRRETAGLSESGRDRGAAASSCLHVHLGRMPPHHTLVETAIAVRLRLAFCVFVLCRV
jgi:hypothetical protein